MDFIREQAKDFRARRLVTSLFKGFLVLLEDLEEEHFRNFDKLKNALPKEYAPLLDQADYLDEQKMDYLRKKVLDAGNSCIRELEN